MKYYDETKLNASHNKWNEKKKQRAALIHPFPIYNAEKTEQIIVLTNSLLFEKWVSRQNTNQTKLILELTFSILIHWNAKGCCFHEVFFSLFFGSIRSRLNIQRKVHMSNVFSRFSSWIISNLFQNLSLFSYEFWCLFV